MKKMLWIAAALLMWGCGNVNHEETMPADTAADVSFEKEDEANMKYDLKQFRNVEITGIEISSLDDEELSVLYAQAAYVRQ